MIEMEEPNETHSFPNCTDALDCYFNDTEADNMYIYYPDFTQV